MRAPFRGLTVVSALTALALATSACGGSDSETSDGSGGYYTLGVLNSLTGAQGVVGQQESKGMALAVEEINAAGGVNGRKLKLEEVDDQGSVNLTTSGFKKLAAESKVPVIIGPGITANAKAAAPLADQYGVTNILLTAQPEIANGTKNVFAVPAAGLANSQAMVNYAKEKGAKTAAIISSSTPYGQAGSSEVTAAAKEAGITIVSSDSFDPSKFDFTNQVSKATSKKPDALFLYGAGGSGDGLVLKAVAASGYQGHIIGNLTYVSTTVPETAGKDAAAKMVGLSPVDYGAPDADTQKLLDAYKAKYNELPTVLSVYAYVGVKMAAAAIDAADSDKGTDIAKALQGLDYQSILGTFAYTDEYRGGPTDPASFKPVSFDKDGEFAAPAN